MAYLKVTRLKTYSGGEIEIHESDDGDSACPVCGIILSGEPAWYLSWPVDAHGKQIGESSAVGSHNICPCCDTHWGYDDSPDGDGELITTKWAELRGEWLNRVPHTPAVVEQLKNIGVNL